MAEQLLDLHGTRVVVLDADGAPLRTDLDAVDLLGDLYEHNADLIAIPAQRLDAGFFTLSTGIAGSMLQKFVGYRQRVAIVGDISAQLAASAPLRSWVLECNRTSDVWFVADIAELDERLGPSGSREERQSIHSND